MKGPLATERDGDAALHRAAITLCKSARLLPAALCVTVENAYAIAREHDLTLVTRTGAMASAVAPLSGIVSARHLTGAEHVARALRI